MRFALSLNRNSISGSFHAYGRDQIDREWSEPSLLGRQSLHGIGRCGGSSNKPFCDGTHAKIGFHAKPADLKVLAEHTKVEA